MIPIPLGLLTNKYLWVALAVTAALAGGYFIIATKIANAEERGYKQGLKDERLVWQIRENHELNAANALITSLQEKYRALERKSAIDVAKADRKLQEGIAHAQADRDHFVVGVRSGAIRLRIPGASSCESPAGDPPTSASARTSERDASPGAHLPPKISEDLYALMAEADEVVLQLQAAQEIIRQDREVCK